MPKVETKSADLSGGWKIEYIYGCGSVNRGAPEQALHVLRLMGDITRPDELRAAINKFRTEQAMMVGPTILHTPLGEMARWDAPGC